MKRGGEMSTICSECGSDNVGFDAWVDENGEVIGGPYDNSMCMDCEATDCAIEEK